MTRDEVIEMLVNERFGPSAREYRITKRREVLLGRVEASADESKITSDRSALPDTEGAA